MRRLRLAAPLSVLLILVPAASAATPGTYRGALLSSSGKRLSDARATLVVRGDRVRLSARNLRATCPYLDEDGRAVRLRVHVQWSGYLRGTTRVDGVASVRGGSSELRLVGRFSGRRFTGRLTMRPAEGVTGACSGSHRVVATRPRR